MPRPTILAHAVGVMRENAAKVFFENGGQVHVHGTLVVLPDDATVEEIAAIVATAKAPVGPPTGAPPVPGPMRPPSVIGGGGPTGAPPPPA